jgi:hypothetical protein
MIGKGYGGGGRATENSAWGTEAETSERQCSGETHQTEGFVTHRTTRDLSGTIIRGTLKTPNSQLVTPISIKLQRPDGYD